MTNRLNRKVLLVSAAMYLIATAAVPTWFAADARVQYRGYYISLTFDDGPKLSHNPAFPHLPPGGGTDLVLDALLALNSRPGVVCGKNPEQFGVLPCRAGIGCGRVCGTISRVKVTFYVNGNNATLLEAWNHPMGGSEMIKRILAEGHEIANHTTTHGLQTGANHATIRKEIEDTELKINQALLFDLEATIAAGVPTWEITPARARYGTFTDFYGRTYSMDNRFRSKSFRPNQFTMGPNFYGIDRNFFGPGQHLPWIFAGLDVDDWRGHTAAQMAHYLLRGNAQCSRCAGWCSIGSNGIQFPGVLNRRDAADGGIVLLHDGTANFQAGIDMLPLIVPQFQELGYHFVAMENMFEFMDAEPEFIPPNPRAGQGNGTRVNDWVIRRSPPVSIVNANRRNDIYGIRFAANPVSSDNAEINITLPDNMQAVETRIVAYDMTGNVVWASTGSATGLSWDLRNNAGRFVANGTYLVVAEVRDRNGRVYTYSAHLGVKR